jgi:hypothetical protein
MDKPRVNPLAFRANVSSSAINSPFDLRRPTMDVRLAGRARYAPAFKARESG